MAKLPAFQFYPADWRKDLAVQSLDYHDRGVWFEMLCLMHESGERGKLLLNGQKLSEDSLARLLGLDKQILTSTLTTLITSGVAKVEQDSGVIYCKRMVEDEHLRQIRSEAGKQGGNPLLVKQNPTTPVKQNPTPSSSVPSSSSLSYSSSEDLKRLIERVVAENSDIDPRIVEIGVIHTLLQRNGSTAPINSVLYFDPEIQKVNQGALGLTASGKPGKDLSPMTSRSIDTMLKSRRQQMEKRK